MTPEYILRKSLVREPRCFSAHVIGQGYVNRGDDPATRADYDAQRLRSAESEIENLGYASDYAERGYDTPKRGILFANWNVFPRGIDTLLERAGYAVEWSDEWAVCDCMKAFRTQPDSYVWEPAYGETEDGEILCHECMALETV